MNEHVKVDGNISLRQAEELIWLEADLLDRPDYNGWLDLWTQDGHYAIPTVPGETDFENTLNVAYDDTHMRKMRFARLHGGFAISATPAARTVRLLSRLVVLGAEKDALRIRSAMHLTEDKFGRQRTFAANVEHNLVHQDGVLRIRDKIVRLINADGVLTSISYLF